MSPISSTETGFGPGAAGATTPNIPGTPTYNANSQIKVASTNDVLVLTSDLGGPVSIDVPDAYYTPTGLATALQTAMNNDNTLTSTGTITFAVTYNSSTFEFTIDAGTGHTIDYTNTGSDGGATFGFTVDTTAAQTIISDSPVEASDTVTFDFSDNSNYSTVQYAIYDNTRSVFIAADGGTDASEVWQTYAQWNGGGASGRVTVNGLTAYTAYTFKVKAKNTLDVETAYSSSSADMYCNVLVDWGTASDVLEKEVPTGNTKIQVNGITVLTTTYDAYSAGGYGAIAIQFVLLNNSSTNSSVKIEFSEDGVNYATGTHFYTITSANDVLAFTSDQGAANIDVPDSNYATGALLATALQTAMNADNTLTGTGTITFAVTYSTTTKKYTIDAGVGHTIALDYWNSDGGYTFGFNDDKIAAQTITSDESRGSNLNTMTTSLTGVTHTIYWDSYSDAGTSEKDSTVYVRLTPYDATSLGGDAGEPRVTNAFAVDNTPEQTTVTNSDTFTFDKDTTPQFEAVMKPMRGGTLAFFRLTVKDYSDTVILTKDSSESVTGWEYQQAGAAYSAVAITGVSGAYIDGVNKVRYTIQAGDALTAANDEPYKIILEEGELRDRG